MLKTKMYELADLNTAFNLDVWGKATSDNACGYAACAMGHIGLDDRFVEEGLAAVWDESHSRIVDFKVFNRLANGFEAGATFFDITFDESEFLFSPGSYDNDNPTPLDVITHVNQLLGITEETKGEKAA